jgi:predicted lactoylglutathione lyase
MLLTDIRAVLSVSNIENCISFYRDTIEFEIHTYSQADKWVLLVKDGQHLMLQETADFFLHDLPKFCEELKSKISDIDAPQASLAFLYGLTLVDPDGNKLWFAQAPQ